MGVKRLKDILSKKQASVFFILVSATPEEGRK